MFRLILWSCWCQEPGQRVNGHNFMAKNHKSHWSSRQTLGCPNFWIFVLKFCQTMWDEISWRDFWLARLLIYLKYEDGALFPWKRGPIFLLSLYGYFPGRWGSFSMEKRAHFPALFVLLFSRKIGPFFHGKYLLFYQCLSELEFRYRVSKKKQGSRKKWP